MSLLSFLSQAIPADCPPGPINTQYLAVAHGTSKKSQRKRPNKKVLQCWQVINVLLTLDLSEPNHSVQSYVIYLLCLKRVVRATLSPIFKFMVFFVAQSSQWRNTTKQAIPGVFFAWLQAPAVSLSPHRTWRRCLARRGGARPRSRRRCSWWTGWTTAPWSPASPLCHGRTWLEDPEMPS